jgi:hypothetical protein
MDVLEHVINTNTPCFKIMLNFGYYDYEVKQGQPLITACTHDTTKKTWKSLYKKLLWNS